MRVAVVGGGAVGSLLAHALATAGHDVSVVQRAHDGPPLRRPLTRRDPAGASAATEVTVAGSRTDVGALPDLVVFAVKMFDLSDAAAAWADVPDVPALTAQNGVGAEELVARLRPGAPLIAASLTAPVRLDGPGVVRRYRTGGIGLASAGAGGEALRDRLVAAFTRGGLAARAYDDASSMKWSKLIGNLVGNATGALVDLDPGAIYGHPALYTVERRQLLEAAAVVRATGHRVVALPDADVRWLPRLASLPEPLGRPILRRIVGGARGAKSPSLREHVRSGRPGPTEVGWLNGAVVRAGDAAGVPVPVNRALVELVTQAGTDPALARRFAGRPDRLADAVLGARTGG